jgi:hypothetical protein
VSTDDRRVTCDSCGDTLPIPTTREKTEGWETHSINRDGHLYFAHSCPKPNCAQVARMLLSREHRP